MRRAKNLLEPLVGRVLISDPFLNDEYFSRSVILLLDANEAGYMGVLLNKMMGKSVTSFEGGIEMGENQLYLGGPVGEDRLIYLHNVSKIEGAVEVMEGVYVGGDLNIVLDEVAKGGAKVRFFSGYAGWSLGQLDVEMDKEFWVVSDVCFDVFSYNEDLWRESLLALNDDYYSMWVNFPLDPVFN